jgi:hypothetical protein
MPTITMRADNLNERNSEFAQAPLQTPVFLNSVPKCGTHLIRNIMRMFVAVPQQYHGMFVQLPNLKQSAPVAFTPHVPKLSWGHLLFTDESATFARHTRHVLLVRDPYDWVLARARFYLSENFDGDAPELKSGKIKPLEILNLMILGIYRKAPTMEEIFRHNAAGWIGTGVHLVRYEQLVKAVKTLDAPETEAYFRALFAACAMNLPDDWRERVRIGSDRKQSATARENLAGEQLDLPDELPDAQKRLVDYTCPGLRALLGYA